MATFDERRTCRKCGTPAIAAIAQVHPDKGKTYIAKCENENCQWYGITWLFDVNPDGSIPEPKPHSKVYPAIPDLTEQVQARIDAEIARSQTPRNTRGQ